MKVFNYEITVKKNRRLTLEEIDTKVNSLIWQLEKLTEIVEQLTDGN